MDPVSSTAQALPFLPKRPMNLEILASRTWTLLR